MITCCQICGSEKWSRRACGLCHGRDATEDACHRAKEAFVAGKIDVDELERRIDVAVRDPPAPSYAGIRLVMR